MPYAIHFGSDGIKPVEGLGKVKQPVIVGDLLALWAFDDPKHPRYLIDGVLRAGEGGVEHIRHSAGSQNLPVCKGGQPEQ